MFGRGAEVLGRYVCSMRASSFLPFLIKFLEASLECCLLLELVFPDLDWVVLFFGAKGAVAFFQKIIEGALGEISVDIVIVIYVDNILVTSLEVEQHVREVETVIRALMKVGLRLKPSKCKIGFSSIQFMGAVLDSSKRGIDPHKVKVFASMWRLRTGKEVQKVLGYLNFLRDFIPLYANIVGLMEGLRSAKVILNNLWKESGGEGAFELAKKVLSEALTICCLFNKTTNTNEVLASTPGKRNHCPQCTIQ